MRLHALILLLCALYGSVFTWAKFTLQYASPVFITGARMCLAGILLLCYQRLVHPKACFVRKQVLWPIFLSGFLGVYVTNVLEFWGLQFMTTGKACFIYSFSPIASAILSYLWFKEKITLQQLFGLALGCFGFVPLLWFAPNETPFTGTAELALLGSAVANAIGWIAIRRLVKHEGYPLLLANATTMLCGGVLAMIHSLFSDTWPPVAASDLWPFLGWFLLLTAISNLISYNLHAYLLKHFTATYLSFLGLTQPFFAAFFGWLFFAETTPYDFWVSIALVSAGLYLYYQGELKQGYTVQTNN